MTGGSVDDFADRRLDLRPSRVGNLDIIGNAYEYLIGRFAAGAGKNAAGTIHAELCD